MSKKHPVKNNDPSINLRLPQELKDKIQGEASKKNLTVSKYVRELLETIYSGDYCRKEVIGDKVESFLFSKDFLQLVVWMNSKRTNKKKTETKEELERYISTLKRVDEHLPVNLVCEFDKVLQDLIKLRNDESKLYLPSYNFVDSYSEKEKFDFDALEEFLLNDNALSQFVFIEAYKTKIGTIQL